MIFFESEAEQPFPREGAILPVDMATSRESWFYEGGEDCTASPPPEAGNSLPARLWSAEELDGELPATDGSREEGAGFMAAALGIGLCMALCFVILYGVAFFEESSRHPDPGNWGAPVDEEVWRELPTGPGALPKFLEGVSAPGILTTPFLYSLGGTPRIARNVRLKE